MRLYFSLFFNPFFRILIHDGYSNLAVAISPIGAYVAAVNGVQSLFVFLLLFFFPLGQRAKPTPVQWFAVLLIAAGTFFIERG